MNVMRIAVVLSVVFGLFAGRVQAVEQLPSELATADSVVGVSVPEVLPPEQWDRVEKSVDRALKWLVRSQEPEGSFPSLAQGQPGVTSLCTLALLAHGHMPGEGPYGKSIDRAIDYVSSCQQKNGLLAVVAPRGIRINANVNHLVGVSAVYNHAISSLLLSETYAIAGHQRTQRLQPVIEKAIEVVLAQQRRPKQHAADRGGWRYLHQFQNVDSDLSITGWNLMFLRSAKNAGFEVPQKPIDDAVAYIRRCFNTEYGVFEYEISPVDRRSRAMAGAGVLALAHAGYHDSDEAKRAGEWILRHHFDRYNQIDKFDQTVHFKDRYHYGVFNCSQAMYQLGGKCWQQFFPRLVDTLLKNQRGNGSWPAENHYEDGKFGSAYSTALVVLAIGAPNQFLPVFQR